jgi:hypothetical protein
MNPCTRRYFRRHLYIGFSLLFLIILYIYFRIFKLQSNIDDENTSQPKYCDQTAIRKHFMHDKRYFKFE